MASLSLSLTKNPNTPNTLNHTSPRRITIRKPATVTYCSSPSPSSLSITTDQTPKQLSDTWREIHGASDWEGLLNPLNPHLRREIIRYGELAQACYDSFDFDPHSKYCGACKYSKPEFFSKLGMFDHDYVITRYLYATSDINLPNFFKKAKSSSVWSAHANWMGYVAVSSDTAEARLGHRDIVIAWRGTVTYLEWLCDLKDILKPAGFGGDASVKIESGFLELYTKKEEKCRLCSFSAREQVLAEVHRLVGCYAGEEISITVTGHSLGSALAILSAYDVAEVGINRIAGGRTIPISVFSFAGPRVGNLSFKERCNELGVKVLRVVNVHDMVPTVPGIIANEKVKFQKYIEDVVSFPWSYAHVGAELAVDHTESPFVKPTKDPACTHNLELLLHLVDGHGGGGDGRFVLTGQRDVALLNKNCDLLRREYGIPPHWRQDENKGMVRNGEGRWVVPDRSRLDAHPPDLAHHVDKIVHRLNRRSSGGELKLN